MVIMECNGVTIWHHLVRAVFNAAVLASLLYLLLPRVSHTNVTARKSLDFILKANYFIYAVNTSIICCTSHVLTISFLYLKWYAAVTSFLCDCYGQSGTAVGMSAYTSCTPSVSFCDTILFPLSVTVPDNLSSWYSCSVLLIIHSPFPIVSIPLSVCHVCLCLTRNFFCFF